MTLVSKVRHETIEGLEIEIYSHAKNLTNSWEGSQHFEDGYLECILNFEGEPTWGFFIARLNPGTSVSGHDHRFGLITLGSNEELLNLGVMTDHGKMYFYAEVENIFTLRRRVIGYMIY